VERERLMGPEMEACPFSTLSQDAEVDVDEKIKFHEIDLGSNGEILFLSPSRM